MKPISRRTFLAGSAAVVLGACSGDDEDAATTSTPTPVDAATTTSTAAPTTTAPATTAAPTTTTTSAPAYPGTADPFTLGVASGDPDATSVVLWTRLLPAGEVLDGEVPVVVDVASDDSFSDIVTSLEVVAVSAEGHSLHVVVDGLAADSWYAYRFVTGSFTSPVGRARTAPAAGETPAQCTIGSASCQNFQQGWYTAHRDIAAAGLDLVVFLGDYIYEGGSADAVTPDIVRLYGTPEPMTLDEYRGRYALYKSDPDLQAAHASCPWLVVWDDHEVENNYAGLNAQDASVTPDAFRERRAAAYRAWWEHMPVRLPPPDSADFSIYRSVRYGDLVDVSLLDTRQYRNDQACGDVTLSLEPPCPEATDPARTMLGDEQEVWLVDRLTNATARWNVLGQQVILGNTTFNGAVLNYDQWDGYPIARDRLLQTIADAAVPNLVVLTGDIHLSGIGNLRAPNGTLVGVEFVATSISSGGNVDPALAPVVAAIPDIVDVELAHRGWIKHTVTPDAWQAEYRLVDNVKVPDSAMTVFGTYAVAAGIAEATKVS